MSYIEPFVIKHVKRKPEEIGVWRPDDALPISKLIATRRGLTVERLLGKRRRGSVMNPGVICSHGVYYVIDGHHKVMRAHKAGLTTILCKIFDSDDARLTEVLKRRGQGPIISQPIVE